LIKIGLTGGIGTGKSFILDIFKKEGFFTVKADELAKTLYYNNEELKKLLIKSFGKEFYLSENKINKEKLEYILYYNKKERDKFNNIFYPVFKNFQKDFFNNLSEKHKIIIYESALIFEVGTFELFDKIILVHCSEEKQKKRIKRRGLSDDKIKRILSFQYSYKKLEKHSDFIINTNKNKEDTLNRTNQIIKQIKLLSYKNDT
jgi:dephospho-CoA kinase